jgi:hypothetical protein
MLWRHDVEAPILSPLVDRYLAAPVLSCAVESYGR